MKKSIDIKTVRKIIMNNREQGISDEETYASLQEQYYDKRTLVKLIKTATTHQKIARYKKWNILLIVLCVLIFVLMGILYVMNWIMGIPGFNSLFSLFVMLEGFAISGLLRYNLFAYIEIIGLMSILFLLSTMNLIYPNLFSTLSNLQLIVLVFNVILSLFAIILAVFLKCKLFIPRKEQKLMRFE